MQIIQELKPTEVYRAFRIWPGWIYQLEQRGILPERPKRQVTKDWLEALVHWFRCSRGDLPAAAVSLCEQAGVTL